MQTKMCFLCCDTDKENTQTDEISICLSLPTRHNFFKLQAELNVKKFGLADFL